MKALVSIIMPVFNAEQYVAEAITSVIGQSYAHWELLIVNDGSTDSSRERIMEVKDGRIRYFEQPNKGTSTARNMGLANMGGEFFCFLDADDRMPEESISARIAVFAMEPKVSFVDGTVIYYNRNLTQAQKRRDARYRGNPIPALCSLDENCFFGNTWMFKRMADVQYRFEPELTHCEDLLFYVQYAHGGEFAFTSEEVLHYRTGNVSAMTSLVGLERGYRFINQRLPSYSHVPKASRILYRQKSRSVMFRSYLGRFKFFGALRVLLTW